MMLARFYVRRIEHSKSRSRGLPTRLMCRGASDGFWRGIIPDAGAVALAGAATTLETSAIRCDDVVKSFEGLSISLVSSGSSLHATADKRTAKTTSLATLVLKSNFIGPRLEGQQLLVFGPR